MATGIEVRHARGCRSDGDNCNCVPSYRAQVWSKREKKVIRKSFATFEEARDWRQDAQVALRKGAMRMPTKETVATAADAWLEGARKGAIRNRSGDPYKPSAVRSYERALRLRVLPVFGRCRLSDVQRSDLQELVEELIGEGHSESTIQMTFMPLRAIFRREVALGRIAVNPTSGLVLPAVRGGRDRIADPSEAARLIAALPVDDRALWATALYGGLRRGELLALRWQDVDLGAGVIRVERGWDDKEGVIELKSRQGRRRVPIAVVLRDYLTERKVSMTVGTSGLVFGRTAALPFHPGAVTERADKAWKESKLNRITLHEGRHTFASLMIAAGVNAKALSTYMGHANISITLDRYGHLMPGNEDEAAELLDAYLERANTKARIAQIGA